MFLLFQIGRRWSEAMMHGWGSYCGHVPKAGYPQPKDEVVGGSCQLSALRLCSWQRREKAATSFSMLSLWTSFVLKSRTELSPIRIMSFMQLPPDIQTSGFSTPTKHRRFLCHHLPIQCSVLNGFSHMGRPQFFTPLPDPQWYGQIAPPEFPWPSRPFPG